MRRYFECPICGSKDGLFEETEPNLMPAPVAWRWTNRFGKEVITSNREFAESMMGGEIHIEPLFVFSDETT